MPDSKYTGVHPIEVLYPRSLKHLSHKLHEHVTGKLWAKVLFGMFAGIIVGFLLGPNVGVINPDFSFIIAEWIALPGTLFLRGIQMIVIPLVFASIIRGIAASENIDKLRKTGLFIAGYFIITTTIAIIIGISLAFFINPGQYVDASIISNSVEQFPVETGFETPAIEELPSMISTILPTNFFGSAIEGEMLQIVIFAIIFGLALVNMRPSHSKPIIALMGSLQDVCMTIVKWIMVLAPLAVFGLIARLVSQLGIEALLGLGAYVVTVLIGLLILILFYLILLFFLTGTKPLSFISSVKDVQLLAFSTSSSAAVMPLSIKTAEEKLNVRPSIAQFIIPIGATVNMDGTALYQAIATIFIAQVFGIDLTLTALLFLIVTIVGASIGSPATPGVGVVILAAALGSMGIPVAGIAIILGVDRILDMCRTAVNVTGDLTACVLMNKFIGGKFTAKEEIEQQKKMEVRRMYTGEDVLVSGVT